MSLVLIPVKFKASRANGDPVQDATVRAVLTVAEADDGIVVPDNIIGTTDVNGEVTLNLWPNARGTNGSQYIVVIEGDDLYFSGMISVPEVPNTAWPLLLETLINQPPFPSRSAAETAQLLAQQAAIEAKAARDEGVPAASTATAQATIASNAAGAAALAQGKAEAARDGAVASGKLFDNTVDGLAGSSGAGAANRFFVIPSTSAYESLILYRNDAGATTEIKRWPSQKRVSAVADLQVVGRSFVSLRPTIRPPATFFKKRASLSADVQALNHGYVASTTDASLYDTATGVYKPFPNSTVQIIFHGDSITWGGSAGLFENYITRMIRDLYVSKGIKANFKNRGINGQGFNYVYAASGVAQNLIDDAAASVDAARDPKVSNYLVVWAGTNDAMLGGRTPAQINTDATAYIDARIAAGWDPTKIEVVTMLPRQAYSEANRTTINANFAALAVSRGTKIGRVDQNAFIGAAGQQNNATYFLDQIHPTDLGHSIAAPIIQAPLFP